MSKLLLYPIEFYFVRHNQISYLIDDFAGFRDSSGNEFNLKGGRFQLPDFKKKRVIAPTFSGQKASKWFPGISSVPINPPAIDPQPWL